MKIKEFFARKGVGYYLLLPALICAVAALVLYTQTGITQFNPSLSTAALVCLGISAGLCLVSLIFEFKPIKYLAYLICLYGFFAYVQSQITYIANVFVSIDGNSFTATAVLFLLAFVLMLVSAILTGKKKKEEVA